MTSEQFAASMNFYDALFSVKEQTIYSCASHLFSLFPGGREGMLKIMDLDLDFCSPMIDSYCFCRSMFNYSSKMQID